MCVIITPFSELGPPAGFFFFLVTMKGAGYPLSDGKAYPGSPSTASRRHGRDDKNAGAATSVAGRESFKGDASTSDQQ